MHFMMLIYKYFNIDYIHSKIINSFVNINDFRVNEETARLKRETQSSAANRSETMRTRYKSIRWPSAEGEGAEGAEGGAASLPAATLNTIRSLITNY